MEQKNNKLILIMCDGKSDDITLHNSLKNYVLNKVKNIDVKVLDGDLAYRKDVCRNNCTEKLNEIIDEFLQKHHIFITDVAMIIHIIYTDCAFIDQNLIVEDLTLDEYPKIVDEVYFTSKYNEIIEKFKNKTEIYEYLSSLDKLRNVPYRVYYFSRNL